MVSDRVRKQIEKRDPACWHCGQTEDLVIHHRRNRGMGGSKLIDTVQNLIRVCNDYNSKMESDPQTAAEAREFGHKLQSWREMSDPVFDTPNLTWYKLTEDGDRVKTEAPSYLI
jgi:5-methylcytosine-specific restriction endonuclease McrA